MSNPLRRVLFCSIPFFCLVLILLIAFPFALETAYTQRFIQDKLNSWIPGSVTWKDFRFSVLRNRFTLEDIIVSGPAGGNLVTVDSLSFKMSFLGLLRHEMRITDLFINRPWVNFSLDRNGELPLVKAFVKEDHENNEIDNEFTIPFNLAVLFYRIVDAKATFSTHDGKYNCTIGRASIEGKGNLNRRELDVTLSIDGAEVSFPRYGAEFSHVHLSTTFVNQHAERITLRIETRESAMILRGTAEDIFSNPSIDMSVDFGVSLQELGQVLRLGSEMSGKVSAGMRVKGAAGNPDLRVAGEYSGGIIGKEQVGSLSMSLGMEDRLVQLEGLAEDGPQGRFRVSGRVDLHDMFPEGFFSPPYYTDRLQYDLRIEGDGVDLARLPVVGKHASGSAEVRVLVRGEGVSLERMKVGSEVEMAAQARIAGFGEEAVDIRMEADIGLSEGVVRIGRMDSSINGALLTGDGCVDILGEQLDARVLLVVPAVGDVLPVSISGFGRGEVLVKGPFFKPEIGFSLEGDSLSYGGVRIGDLFLRGAVDGAGALEIEELMVRNGGSIVEGRGSIQVFGGGERGYAELPIDLLFRLQRVEMKDFLVQEGFAEGVVEGTVEVGGTVGNPGVHFELGMSGVRFEGVEVGDLYIEADYSDRRMVHVNRLLLEKNRSTVHLQGEFLLPETLSMDVFKEMELNDVEVAAGPVYLEDYVEGKSGRISARAHIEGTILRPVGTVVISGNEVDVGIQRLQEVLIESRLRPEGIWVDRFEADIYRGERVWGEGFLTYDRVFEFDLTSGDLSLQHLDVMEGKGAVEARVLIDISGRGTVDSPVVTGGVKVSDLFVEGKPINGFDLALELRDDTVAIRGREVPISKSLRMSEFPWMGGVNPVAEATNIRVEGLYHLREKDFSVSVEIENTDLSPYFLIMGVKDLKGTATGTVSMRGNTQNLKGSSASVSFSRLHIKHEGNDLLDTRDLSAQLDNGEYIFNAPHLIVLKDGRLNLTGTGNLDGSLDFNILGRIPFPVIGFFISDLEDISGDLFITAHLGGSTAVPETKGSVELRGIGFSAPPLYQKVHDLNGTVSLSAQLITFDRIAGMLDTGRFVLSGEIDLEQKNRFGTKLNLSASALPLHVPGTMDLLMNANLDVQATPGHAKAKGEIQLLDGVYYRDMKLSVLHWMTQTKEEINVAPSTGIDLPYLKDMDLDLIVKRRGSLIIDNNLAQLSVNPDLRVTGKINDLVITGRADIESGTVNYRKRTFLVRKGIIDFLNPFRTDPLFDILGETKIRDWIVQLKISGKPDNLMFELTSIPPEEDIDILSLIATGKTAHEYIEKERRFPTSTAQMLADIITTSVEEDIRRAAGLDTFTTETTIGETSALPERVKVTLGKELTRRLSLGYSLESKKGILAHSASAEYKILENTYISGFQDNQGRFGGAIRFRLEYR